MFNGIESSCGSEIEEDGHIIPEPTEIRSGTFQLGPKDPNWREGFKKATRREFSERFSPYDLGDRDDALEYYRKYKHLF